MSLSLTDIRVFREIASGNAFPAFSPDGRWLAYASAESGVYEVWVRPFPDTGKQFQVSTSGGTLPVWSRASNELFYRTEDQHLMVTTYSVSAEGFTVNKPRVWSPKEIFNTGLTLNFDLTPDGKRFAVLMPEEVRRRRDARRDATLVLNFFEDVRRVAGVSK